MLKTVIKKNSSGEYELIGKNHCGNRNDALYGTRQTLKGIIELAKNFGFSYIIEDDKMSKEFVMNDSGKREEFTTGAIRDVREGKGRYDLISPFALKRLAIVYEKGAQKYNGAKSSCLSPNSVLECLVTEVGLCKNVVNVTASFIQKECVEVVTKKIYEQEIKNLQNSNEKTVASGEKNIQNGLEMQQKSEEKIHMLLSEIRKLNEELHSEKSDLLKKVAACSWNGKIVPVQYVVENLKMLEQSILIMIITREMQEDIFVVGATTELECLQNLLSICNKQYPIYKILQLNNSSKDDNSIEIVFSGARNWEAGMPHTRYFDSAIRHLNQWLMGHEDEDHLGHAMWNVAAIIHMQETHPELDDRPTWITERTGE